MEPLFYDTETYGTLNLKKVGGDKYARHPDTECLIITWGFSHGPIKTHDFTQQGPIPQELKAALMSPYYIKIAFNQPFDRAILMHTLGIEVPWSECMDAMTLANSLGFTGSMGKIQDAMGFAEESRKIKNGNKLIQMFCKPAPKNHNADRYDHGNKPAEWLEFLEYGKQDTGSMRMMWNLNMEYNPMSDLEWHYWRLTQEMNQRGIPVDIVLVQKARHMAAERKLVIKAKMTEMTGVPNPNSAKQIIPWLSINGVDLPNMQAATLDAYILGMQDGVVKDLLTLKRIFSMTAVKKWDSFESMAVDGLIRGTITFRGAARTARDASRGINLQNMSRPPKGDMDVLVEPIYNGGNTVVQMLYGEPLTFLAKTVRGAITAPEGNMLAVSDLGSIESRALGWLAGCIRMNNIFAEGKDTYKDFATELFNIHYENVTKEQRNFSKPPVLGSGYMMGAKGLQAYAEKMGVIMTEEESLHATRVFRESYPEIVSLWAWLIRAVQSVLLYGKPQYGYYLTIYKDRDFLFIRLPSGRSIAYHQPLWENWDTPIGRKPSFTYMGINRFTTKWERISAHAGGITENIIQAIARDILMVWVERLPNLDIRLRVHDELVAVVDKDLAERELQRMNMSIAAPIDWAPGLLLTAEGDVVKHYGK